MKKSLLIPSILLLGSSIFAQHMGNAKTSAKMANAEYANANYSNNNNNNPPKGKNAINININHTEDITLSIKGMTNVKIDNYVAIFSLTQTGKDIEEVNKIIDSRINNVKAALDKEKLEYYVDVISFVPMYEFEVEKKIFSKKTYNEVPSGFEVKKNIHVKYADAKSIHKIMEIMSSEEIYDLAEVDCYSNNIEAIKKELQAKGATLLKEKMKLYEGILNDSFASREKTMADGFEMFYPSELYDSYQAYNSSSIKSKRPANIVNADKDKTFYYNPVLNKDFDFVINPVITETSIQVLYEVKLYIRRPKAQPKPQEPAKNRYFTIGPDGQAREIFINNTDK